MRLGNIITTSIALIFLSGCSTLSVDYDFDQKANFSQYKKYDWLPFPKDMKVDELNRARFVTAVENNLASKGFNQNSSNPDFVIATHFGKENKVDITNWGYTYAPNGYYGGYGYRHRGYAGSYANTGGVSVYEYEQGTLILDLVDANTRKLIWRATAKAIVSPASTPEKQTEKIENAVQEILQNFPPKSLNTDTQSAPKGRAY
ncbi:MAG: hypothetical protein DIZ80_12055 [endosymbiont of Galathealinum brachiosum]|uniref:DUF4136 domain-containing protein n=1 Tax=endosymbiont of Galathealinum brachiosum TaxID=2200906 RepID=A0A370DEK5_9GAMM|nr:MAG: hypothetical protein DIZ80_12055 [endosymbiont of Galathealinum brachiosum]